MNKINSCNHKIKEWDGYFEAEKKKAEAEAKMLTQINIIAINHNCKVVDIDFEKNIINIVGSSENELDCACKIGDYIESAGGELF